MRADPGQQATPATRLATFADSGGTPTASRAEYDTSEVIPPAAPTVPATTPAAISTIDSPGPDGTAESLAAPPPITTIVVALCSTAYRKRPCS